MGLQLSVTLSTSDCSNLVFTETTGLYSSGNLTGWGTPNPLISNATAASIIITTPSGSQFTFPILNNGFPNAINGTYSIPSTSLGMSTSLQDGQYSVVYIITVLVSGIPFIFSTTDVEFVACNLECCIDRLLNNIGDWSCDCSKDAKDKYLNAFGIFQQIQHSIECKDFNTTTKLLSIGNKLCKNLNCSTCQ